MVRNAFLGESVSVMVSVLSVCLYCTWFCEILMYKIRLPSPQDIYLN